MHEASPAPERLLELVDRMAGQPVLMLVDMVADRFVTGTPKRISREAPVLILRHEEEELLPGGGANAVANVAALGGVPLPVGIVGADASGDELLAELAARGIATAGIVRVPGYRTPTKVRILAGGRHAIKQQVVRYDIEGELRPSSDVLAALAAAVERWSGHARVAVLSDYGYGAVDPSLVGACRAAVGAAGTLLCDSRYRLADFAGLDGATPNEEEAEALLGARLGDDAEALRRGGAALRARLGGRFLLVTRGSLGMALFEEGRCAHVPVHGTDQVADVTGAGDTVIGTYSLALAAGATPLEAALLANYAGGVVVMKRGTATLDREELAAAVRAGTALLEEVRWEKVLTVPELVARAAELRRQGRTLAFANGHFDLLHVGHLRYLRAAREQADALVVAINDDDSVARLKGPGRPLVPAAERAELLAALEPVDFVVVFAGDSPSSLLARVRPDVHCKGTDYGTPEKVPEYATVRAYGGRTVLVGDPKDHATSDLIARVRALPAPPKPAGQ